MPAIRRSAVAFAAFLSLCCLPALAQQHVCTPFGNPPQVTLDTLNAAGYALTRCQDGGTKLNGYTDANGSARQACLWDNADATPARPLPLVIYLQASLAPLDLQIAKTGLLDARRTALLGEDARPGFLLLAPMPRYTRHYYPLPNAYSLGFDVWYRQFASGPRSVGGVAYPANTDFATIDHYIAGLLGSGRVDPRRVYLVGYSNGASAAVEYAQNRAGIAAAAVYSAPDPYGFLQDPCPQRPVAGPAAGMAELQVTRRNAPIFHLHRDCDAYGSCPNALKLQRQITESATALMFTQTVNRDQLPVSGCDAACGSDANGSPWNLKARLAGTGNHNTWPLDWNARLLGFLREHPLPR